MNETGCPPSKVPIKSLYQRLVERNRCNHRDFQVHCFTCSFFLTLLRLQISLFAISHSVCRANVRCFLPCCSMNAIVGQNIAVNGARTGSMAPPEGIVTTMKSRSTNGNGTFLMVPLPSR